MSDNFMKKILFVDDDDELRKIFKIFILNLNIEYLQAQNGHEAVRIAHKEKPDLIIMDYKMPSMNGLEAIREIKSSILTENIPIILYTGFANEVDEESVKDMGCVEVLYKPIESRLWISIVNKYIN